MGESIKNFLSSENFMPHGHCYFWRPEILWLNVGSDAVIAFSYFAIPAFLIYFVNRRKDLAFNLIFIMFALFIIACGTSHVMSIWTVWNPNYGTQGLIKAFTAGISLVTAVSLWPLMSKALALPSLQDIQRSSEKRFSKVIDAAPNGLLMVDKTGEIVLCNTEIELLFGYKKQELVGQKIEILVPERFRKAHPTHRMNFFNSPETRQMGAGRDLYGLRKDGFEFPVEIGLNPLVLDEGTFVLASIVDITKRKTLEDRVRQSADAIQQKNVEMEQFVYTVSHDLKSPLVTSTGFLGLLKEDVAAERYDKLADSIRRLEGANHRMGQLINDLLQLSRVGRIRLEIDQIDMNELVSTVKEDLANQIKAHSADVLIQKGMPSVRADRRRIYQVFENLMVNALKYACDGANPKIEIGAEETVDELRYYVRDQGPGIAKEYHQKIFGLFQRLESDNRGTGVGLTIVSRAMQIHGGRVWVESNLGAGATFWLSFSKKISLEEINHD